MSNYLPRLRLLSQMASYCKEHHQVPADCDSMIMRLLMGICWVIQWNMIGGQMVDVRQMKNANNKSILLQESPLCWEALDFALWMKATPLNNFTKIFQYCIRSGVLLIPLKLWQHENMPIFWWWLTQTPGYSDDIWWMYTVKMKVTVIKSLHANEMRHVRKIGRIFLARELFHSAWGVWWWVIE